ncbi:MAG TPA: hypothetical protein VFU89_08530 [Rhabdochlamydiaceae bacterium]|nr:hypothetical protein [Rhabdochlamydiaceae bacterium]
MTATLTLNTSLARVGISDVLALPGLVLTRVRAAVNNVQKEIFTAAKAVSREFSAFSASKFAYTVVEKGKTVLADPRATLAKVDAAFAALKEKLETPLEVISCGLEWAALSEHLEHYAESASHVIGRVAAPLVLTSLISKIKKVHQAFFGAQIEGAQTPKTSEVVSAGLSIFSRLCGAISWLQKTGFLTQAVAISGKMNALMAFSNLAITMIDLRDAIQEHKDKIQILKAALNVVGAMGTIVLLASLVDNLPFLLLLLGTGTLILNIMYPEQEHVETAIA